ncbi:MAG: PASTA domain-containing protein, partial [Nocardioides sp.]
AGQVTVTLSRGKERYPVPTMRGRTEDQAQDALAETRLAVGERIEQYDDEVPAGSVIATSPAAGTKLRPDEAVDLIVSKGRRPIQLRDFTGRSGDRAQAWLERRQFAVTRNDEFSDSVATGLVIAQQPNTGAAFRGDAVTLVVSKGPQLVTVPAQLRGARVEDATQALRDLGLNVETREADQFLGLGFVFDVQPAEGSQVPVGSTVVLIVI